MDKLAQAMRIVERAARRAPQEREAFVRAECHGDPELFDLAWGLMRSEVSRESGSSPNPRAGPDDPTRGGPSGGRDGDGVTGDEDGSAAADHNEFPPVGRKYRLRELIGEGGYGVVYRAQQLEPVRREVAVKLIRPGMNSGRILQRFELERQALAVMDHPCVARVFDGGLTPSGRPYFAMEYVDGVRITDHCRRASLPLREKLDLFVSLCDAVHHAHQKGVIHRDLSPNNVLVTLVGGRAVPKVIDFGIAKALDPERFGICDVSMTGQAIGTPMSMSPEQVAGSPDIDTRTDVYALGVLLYELISGTRPFDFGKLSDEEMRRTIREVDPPLPGTRSGSTGGLPRDLQQIPMKAMRKDRTRRYSSALELGRDVQRFLDGYPVEAAPESWWYRAEKFVRRNRVLVGSAVLVALALGAGLGTAMAQRNEARRQREAAFTVTEFVKASLGRGNPRGGGQGRQDVTIAEAMVRALDEVNSGRFRDQPAIEADLLDTIAAILDENGRAREALAPAERALAIRRRLFPRDHEAVASSLNNLGAVQQSLGRCDDALGSYGEALGMYRRLFHGDHEKVATAMNNVAAARQLLGRADEALPIFQDVLAMRRRLFPGDHAAVAQALYNLANAHKVLNRVDEAAPLAEQAVEMGGRVFNGDHPDLAQSLTLVGDLQAARGDFNAALTTYQDALAMRERMFSGDHPDIAMALNNVALALERLGRSAEAEPLLERALAMYVRLHPDGSPESATTVSNLATVRASRGDTTGAEAMYRRALDMTRAQFPGDHPTVASIVDSLAAAINAQGRFAEAEPLFAEALAMRRRLYDPPHEDIAMSVNNVASALKSLGRVTEAEPMFVEALTMLQRLHPGDHPLVAAAMNNLADVRIQLDRTAEAEPLLRESLAMRRRLFPGDHPGVATGLNNLGEALRMLGRAEEARPLVREALEMRRRLYPGDHPLVAASTASLAGIERALVRVDEARALYDEALAMMRRVSRPEGSPNLARLLWRSAEARLEAGGDPAEACAELREAVEMAARFLREDHPHLREYRASQQRCTADDR